MTAITVAALQLALNSPDEAANIAAVSALVEEAAGKGAQLILPPELFSGEYFCREEDEALIRLRDRVPEVRVVLPTVPGVSGMVRDMIRRWPTAPIVIEEPDEKRAAFAAAAPGLPPEPVLVAVEGRPPLLLRPAPAQIAATPGPRPVAIAALRLPVREDETRGAAGLRELYRLSPREAALAQKLSRGEMIVEAGRALRLTPETARNYSKRIYARTGARGAADLVRAVLSGLAPLA